jgi:hypothetical protein
MSQRDADPRRQECSGQTDRSDKFLNEQEFLAKVRHVARQIVARVNRVLGEDARTPPTDGKEQPTSE